MCVPPRGRFQTFSCCARWSIGCEVGSVGCCDPARAWQFLGPEFATTIDAPGHNTRRPHGLSRRLLSGPPAPHIPRAAPSAEASLGYALFSKALSSELVALKIDLATGHTTHAPVTGPAAEYYSRFAGEATRLFPFDPATRRFLFADVDESRLGRPLTLYTVNASSGVSAAVPIRGNSQPP